MELQSDTTNQIFLWINIQYVKYCFGWIFIMLNIVLDEYSFVKYCFGWIFIMLNIVLDEYSLC
jgi:hypothetical protein